MCSYFDKRLTVEVIFFHEIKYANLLILLFLRCANYKISLGFNFGLRKLDGHFQFPHKVQKIKLLIYSILSYTTILLY